MHEIVPNLFLSAYHDVKVETNTFVVNCTRNLPMLHENGIRLAVDDDMNRQSIYDMFLALPNIVQQIDTQLQNNKQVVVHCLAGQQRSPAVVAAYLISKRGMELEDAIRFVREKKKDAFFWSVNFRDALEHFVMTLPK